ncbi:hypothetical protein V6N12_035604 [Hibiscus sabdariffa]|uniref:Uncharacterized protein n=1 Tax=Hibiscus sabdariffa TaxID=183260 RepID=A0ABR2EN85_9ROSI
MHLLDKRSTRALPVALMIHDNSTDRTAIVPATHHSNFCPINFRWGGSAGPPHGEHRSARPYCRRCAPGLNWPGRSSGADSDPIVLAFGIGVMINRDSRGHSYFIVRGEILGFMKDEQLRKHLPRMFSVIKNESWGLEDDQIPS